MLHTCNGVEILTKKRDTWHQILKKTIYIQNGMQDFSHTFIIIVFSLIQQVHVNYKNKYTTVKQVKRYIVSVNRTRLIFLHYLTTQK